MHFYNRNKGPILTFGAILMTILTYNLGLKHKCISKWDDSKYEFITGCLVNVKGEYVPESAVRIIKWENVE